MDPVTHALLGGTVARVGIGRWMGAAAFLPGALGALAPDLDVLIRSPSDPLLVIEYHRHFTHALAFAPIGGALAALPWLASARARARPLPYLAAAMLGYATHGPLDAVTTYGTTLFWPFSDARVGLSWISIIDPLFTLILLVGILVGWRSGSLRPAYGALALCVLYLAFGALQRERALAGQRALAQERGHEIARGDAFPGFANLVSWRSLYRVGDTLRFDRIRVPVGSPVRSCELARVPALDWVGLSPAERADPRVAADFARFRWFASDWTARSPTDPSLIGDARYTVDPDRYEPVWGVRFTAGAPIPTEWVDRSRERRLRGAGAGCP